MNPIAKWMTATAHACLASALSLVLFSTAFPGEAVEARSVSYELDIPAEDLDAALQALALASNHKLLYRASLVVGKTSHVCIGTFTAEEAVRQVLIGTGLEFDITPAAVVLIKRKGDGQSADTARGAPASSLSLTQETEEPPSTTSGHTGNTIRMAQASQRTDSGDIAQKLGVQSTQPGSTSLSEIIVTAEKRAEPLSKVPESIGVLTAGTLVAQHAVDMQDVVNRIPGLSSDFAGAPGTSEFTIRGISPGSGLETTTGMYINDVSINMGLGGLGGGAYEPSFFDLDRIEVLRGPQGTLYGADSFGGAIRYVTKEPELDKFGGEATGNFYGQAKGDPGGSTTAAVNLPLIDGALALRLAGIYQYDGGFVNHLDPAGGTVRSDTNTEEVYGFRGTALWQPNDSLKVVPIFQYQTTRSGDTWFYDPALGQYNTPRLLDEPLHDRFVLSAINVTADFGSSSLTSVSSYVDRNLNRIQDFSVYDNSSYIGPAVAAYFDPTNAKGSLQALSAIPVPAFHIQTNQQWAQELRLASHFDDIGLKTLLGLYYDHEVRGVNYHEVAAGFGAETERLFGVGINQALTETFGVPPGVAALGDTLFVDETQQRIDRKAVYVEASWTPPIDAFRALTVTAGSRFSKITFSQTGYYDGFFDGGYAPVDSTFRENQIAPKYGISYQVTDNALLYISAAKGFRLGGANLPLPSFCAGEAAEASYSTNVKTDSIWSYEAGTKLSLLDHSLQLNASAFHINWTNIAEQIVFPNCGFGFEANVGSAISNGGDISLEWRPIKGLDIELGLAYTDARFSTTISNDGVLRGEPIPFSPPWTANISTGYTWPVGGANAYVRANYNYTDTSHGNLELPSLIASLGNFIRPSYGTAGASAGYQIGSWDVSVYSKNLTDAHPALEQQLIVGYDNVSTLRPRQIGVQAKYAF